MTACWSGVSALQLGLDPVHHAGAGGRLVATLDALRDGHAGNIDPVDVGERLERGLFGDGAVADAVRDRLPDGLRRGRREELGHLHDRDAADHQEGEQDHEQAAPDPAAGVGPAGTMPGAGGTIAAESDLSGVTGRLATTTDLSRPPSG